MFHLSFTDPGRRYPNGFRIHSLRTRRLVGWIDSEPTCAHRSARHSSRVDRSFRGAWSHSGPKRPIAPADPAFIHRPDYRTGVRRSRTLAAPARVADAEGKIPIRCIRNLRVWTAHHSL